MAKESNSQYWGTSSTANVHVTSTTSSTSATTTIIQSRVSPAPRMETSEIDNAVYAHMQAIRALGRTQVSSQEVARALGLPEAQVAAAAVRLKSKGIKVVS